MKNKNGFAISSMLYTILLLFLLLLIGILGILGTRKVILDRMKAEISGVINGENDIYIHLQYKDFLVANTSLVDNFTFTPLDIVSVVDKSGNRIPTASISYDSKPSFDSTKNGLYTVTYTGTYQGMTVSRTTTIEVVNPVSYEYAYAGREQVVEVPANGLYQMELWGAGGSSYFGGTAGKGAYTQGNLELEKDTPLYVRVGGSNGYNGGGATEFRSGGASGGGSTDVRLVSSESFKLTQVTSVSNCRSSGGKMCISTSTNSEVSTIALNTDSVIYGPYKHYDAGVYLVTFTGTNLQNGSYNPNVSAGFAVDGVLHPFSFTPVVVSDNVYKYLVYLEKDYDNVEFYMKNYSETTITVTSVTVEDVGSRIMVAAGGGGSERVDGGDGGALTGFQSTTLYSTATANGGGGTQTSGGTKGTGTSARDTYGQDGAFGVGGFPGILGYDFGGSGGGGYYGGGGISYASAGGGGSSFISGYPGCNAISKNPNVDSVRHANHPNHYSGYVFSNTVMKSGKESMPNYGHTGTITGNAGNGYAKVTALIMEGVVIASNLVNNSGFESDLKGWNLNISSSTLQAYSASAVNSGKSVKLDTTASSGTYQNIDEKFVIGQSIVVGHKYYSSEYFKVINEDDSGIKFYAEIVYQNSSGSYKGTLGNYFKTDTTRTGDWQFGSFIFTPVENEEYYRLALRPLITNNVKGVSSALADSVLLIDLTEIYGAGNEPTKEWCDQNIKYFDGTWVVPKR